MFVLVWDDVQFDYVLKVTWRSARPFLLRLEIDG